MSPKDLEIMAKIEHIKSLIAKQNSTEIPKDFSTLNIKKDFRNFHDNLEKEVAKIEGLAQPRNLKILMELNRKFKQTLQDLKSKLQEGKIEQDSSVISNLVEISAKLDAEINEEKSAATKSLSEMKHHQSTMENLLKLHKTIVVAASEAQTKALQQLKNQLQTGLNSGSQKQ